MQTMICSHPKTVSQKNYWEYEKYNTVGLNRHTVLYTEQETFNRLLLWRPPPRLSVWRQPRL
jgi:hypothetical protein